MRLTALLLSGSVAAALTLSAGIAAAQPATNAPAAKPAPAKTKPATPAAKARKPAAKTPPPPPPLPEASEEQLSAAKQAYLGMYECEFKQTINIEPNVKHAGYIDVAYKKDIFTMKPVLSSTGALRLEDVTGRTLMVQIANKSMLLDVKVGQRMVDDCIHPEQRAAIEAARAASAPAGSGLGIAPTGQ
ncbi:hypothetical protein CDN99_11315 [Roseateles aquatilis]|uniref:Uncharacterized protein n=1 Tax=Roseateles aquatilis TaxID=431061 RepID=A0A246JDU9_9BURK|nr:hypothetical protein [Roseateles aquatilis]OWQ90758.1 hypothetical protein CDN99_11315 [Roseateles aquatilis]